MSNALQTYEFLCGQEHVSSGQWQACGEDLAAAADKAHPFHQRKLLDRASDCFARAAMACFKESR